MEQRPAQPAVAATKPRITWTTIVAIILGVGALAVGGLAIGVVRNPSLIIKEEKGLSYPHLTTGGTSVVAVMVENRWKAEYIKHHNIQLDYASSGSSEGFNQMIQKKIAIAFTHAPISVEQRRKAMEAGGEVVQVPILICSVAPVYNLSQLKGKKPLNFTGELLGKIFLGEIQEWHDPQLMADNPDLKLVPSPKPITVVHREESSGTTLIFTDYLAKASKNWLQKFPQFSNGGSEIPWPVGKGAKRNMNLAVEVSQIDGAIGYVDLLYTHFHELELEYGAIQSGAGKGYVRPDSKTMIAAGQAALTDVKDDLILQVANRSSSDAYPISGIIYALCYQAQPESSRAMVADFLHWSVHEGQAFVAGMSYAPLPPQLIERIDARIKSIHTAP